MIMKKIICSLLISVMGFICLNIGAVSGVIEAKDINYNEVDSFETYENTEEQNKKAKKLARAEFASTEAEVNDSVCIVTFDCNGGKYEGVMTFQQTISAGSFLSEPDSTRIKRSKCEFEGWYTTENEEWNFSNDVVNENIELRAKWKWDSSDIVVHNTKKIYLDLKYYNSTWGTLPSIKKSISNVPVEVNGPDFPEEDINTAISKSGIESSYGGCGPLAMIGVLDYFSRYLGYTSIINDPTNSANRITLAYHVFQNTETHQEWWNSNSKAVSEIANTFASGDEKDTITTPDAYVKGFNILMEKYYNLDQQISASWIGNLFVSKTMKTNRIIKSIDKGIPATVYVSRGGPGELGNHYVNIYGYEKWQGIDRDGQEINQTFFYIKTNLSKTAVCCMDADLLDTFFSGVIYYTVKDSNQLIRPSDFSKDFVNENGQGQYYFYDKTADITTANGFKVGTKRLRCGYIEDKYLVLSANRQGAGLAYLEMNFDINVKAFNFDISRWSSKEGVISHIKLYYKDENGKWQELHDFSPVSVTTAKDYMDNYYMTFPVATNGIKFEVYSITANSETNKGRVVLGDMNLFY